MQDHIAIRMMVVVRFDSYFSNRSIVFCIGTDDAAVVHYGFPSAVIRRRRNNKIEQSAVYDEPPLSTSCDEPSTIEQRRRLSSFRGGTTDNTNVMIVRSMSSDARTDNNVDDTLLVDADEKQREEFV